MSSRSSPLIELLAICSLSIVLANSMYANDTILHFFAGGGSNGATPQGDLMLSGSELYGMSAFGGANNGGTIFRLNTNGSGFTQLHSFSTGSNPAGSLILSGSTLYGMTNGGGNTGNGTIFKIDKSGSGFSILHDFTGGINGGSGPLGSLLLSGSTLYGMTTYGGTSNTGTIFSLDTSGSGFNLLHSFTGGMSDGSLPFGSLSISGSTLYGTTANGGASNNGTIFSINTDGSGFNLLHSFSGGNSDGSNPLGSLTISGSVIYGTTNSGGTSGAGTVFKIDNDGTDFNVIHNFAGAPSDGGLPAGSLVQMGFTLYGTTQNGGTNDLGTIFQMNIDGSGFNLLHSFSGGNSDGSNPLGSLISSNGILFGTTSTGGPTDRGTVFSVLPEPGLSTLWIIASLMLFAFCAFRKWGLLGKNN